MIMVLAPLRRKPDSVRREPRAEFALEDEAVAEAVAQLDVAELEVAELDVAEAQ